jgi:hypothetical protein
MFLLKSKFAKSSRHNLKDTVYKTFISLKNMSLSFGHKSEHYLFRHNLSTLVDHDAIILSGEKIADGYFGKYANLQITWGIFYQKFVN